MKLLIALFCLAAIPSVSAQSCDGSSGCQDFFGVSGLANQIERSTPDEIWGLLAKLKPVYSALGNRQKRQIIKVAYQSLAQKNKEHYRLPIFTSTLVKFTKQEVRAFFGESSSELTELTYMRESDGSIRPVILGTSEVSSHTAVRTSGGFWFHKFHDTIPIHWTSTGLGSGSVENINWRHNGTVYVGSIKVTARSSAGIVSASPQPGYESLWRDGELNGLVVLSDTFLHRSATRIASQYLDYFTEQGYIFSEPQAIADTMLFLQDTVASGETDFLVKEAHSEGDSRLIVSVSANSQLLTGIKPPNDGRVETIRIIVPERQREISQRFDFQLFAQAVRMRQLALDTQLVFINSSCDSMFNARNEVALIASPLLVDIAAGTTTTSFVNRDSDPKRGIIEGIRNGLTWEQIRHFVEMSPGFARKRRNDFIFPHQQEYLDNLVPPSGILLGVEITIADEKGRPYFLSDHL